jgi:hypothetical protein
MSKFARTTTKPRPTTPQSSVARTFTHEGAHAFVSDDRTALFTLAATNMVGEATFYESPSDRDARFRELIAKVAVSDPEWLSKFLPWLRDEGNMRTASVVGAVEFARNGGGRKVIADSLLRGDEPAEALAYWIGTYGKTIPAAVKRGIADAAVKLYTERSVLRYDSARNAVRMGDVIRLTHPKPKDDAQSALFTYLVDKRRGRDDARIGGLDGIAAVTEFESIPEDQRRTWIASNDLPGLVSWERLSGWLPGGMDAEAWESAIPNMGYMALLRNLRNFEDAGVSAPVLASVAAKIADPDEVARSRQFPFRFMSAWSANDSMTFGPALEAAMNAACSNVPEFKGRTLVLVDTSGSMTWSTVSARSKVTPAAAAALFGAVISRRAENADVIAFATTSCPVKPQRSVLRMAEEFGRANVGGGTDLLPALARWYAGHDRIIVLTDMQMRPSGAVWPDGVPSYVWDLAGYNRSAVNLNDPNKHLFGGFSDSAFKVIGLLETVGRGTWPWES